MGRGTSGALLVPERDAGEPADSDQCLVAAVRRGDDRAFEILYQRYQRRIHAYVLGMVKDHGRAEDVTQEVFVSALRRMRETEQPLAFKPWLYQIAKNSCIDAFRRSRRTEEVSYDADDALAPADHSKLVGSGPSPDAAVAAKQDLESLCGAFGGLSETHHEILVLRELEGLSYQQIGKRMGLSRPAVESTLFRARRRLTEEYDEIVSGARCLRIQGIIVTALQSRLGARDKRRLARHLSHCQACRREALAAGLDRRLVRRPSVRERVASRVAGLLPFPALAKFRRGADDAAALPPSGRGAQWASQLPLLSDHLTSGWGKAAAGAAILAASVGTGVGVHTVATPSERPAAVVAALPAKPAATASPAPSAPQQQPSGARTTSDSASGGGSAAKRDKRDGKRRSSKRDRASSSAPGADSGGRAMPGGSVPPGGGPQQPTPADSNPNPAMPRSGKDEAPAEKKPAAQPRDAKPAVNVPATTADPVKETASTVDTTTDTLDGAVRQTTQGVDDTVQQVTGGGPVSEVVDQTTDIVDEVVGDVTEALDGVTQGLTDLLRGLTGRRGG